MCDVSASSAAPTPRVSDDDPLAGVTQGLTSLSRTQSELKARWHAMKKADSQKAAPTKVPGVHQDALPSYAAGAVAHVSCLLLWEALWLRLCHWSRVHVASRGVLSTPALIVCVLIWCVFV